MKKTILVLATLFTLVTSCKKQAQPTPTTPSQPAVVSYSIKLEVTDTTDNQCAVFDIYINGSKITPTWFGSDIPMCSYINKTYTLKKDDVFKIECRNNNHSGYDLDQDIKIYSNNVLVVDRHQNANTFESIIYICN
jgi:hypothetical protein